MVFNEAFNTGTSVRKLLGYSDATIVFGKVGAVAKTLKASAVTADDSTDTGDSSITDEGDEGVSEIDSADLEFLREIAATTAIGETALQRQDGESQIPVASANELDDDLVYIIDSGADLDIINLKKAMRKVKSYTRSLGKNIPANTGGGEVSIRSGVRAQVADWDTITY